MNWNLNKDKKCLLQTTSTSESQNMAEFINAHYLERLCEIYDKGELRMKKSASTKVQKFDIIVAGVKKCGTSSLQLFMKYHPELQSRRFYAHEGHYFDLGKVYYFFKSGNIQIEIGNF